MNDKVTYGIIGLLVGIILTWIAASTAVNHHNDGMMQMMGMRGMMTSTNMMRDDNDTGYKDASGMTTMSGAMQGMMQGLDNKTGDEFDKAFLAEMSLHHQGAIEMANAALKNAKHQEIKDLANNIITAQTKEIEQMKAWQENWYK